VIFADLEIGALFVFPDEHIEPPIVFRKVGALVYERRIRGDTPRYAVPLRSLPVVPVSAESVHLVELGIEKPGHAPAADSPPNPR
jgi:hypothetical protein